MPFYVGDYLADTMHLTTTQHGAYLLLLMAYWKRQEPIPDDNATIAQITRMSLSEVEASRLVIGKFFKIADGKWVHSRMERDLEKHKKKYLAQSQAATKTNTKRYQSLSVSVSESLSVSQPEPEPEPDINTLVHVQDAAKRIAKRESKKTDLFALTTELQNKMSAMFKRTEHDHWTHMEISTLAQIARRPNCMIELAELEKYRPIAGRFFPHSIERLLNTWTSTLDAARNHTEQEPPKSQPKTIEQTLSEERARDTRKLLKELEL